jgi:hypothetical protein
MPVIRHPPHRSVRAALPHTALTLDAWRQSVHSETDAGYAGWESSGRSAPGIAASSCGSSDCGGTVLCHNSLPTCQRNPGSFSPGSIRIGFTLCRNILPKVQIATDSLPKNRSPFFVRNRAVFVCLPCSHSRFYVANWQSFVTNNSFSPPRGVSLRADRALSVSLLARRDLPVWRAASGSVLP